jgi:hypothetical protein
MVQASSYSPIARLYEQSLQFGWYSCDGGSGNMPAIQKNGLSGFFSQAHQLTRSIP